MPEGERSRAAGEGWSGVAVSQLPATLQSPSVTAPLKGSLLVTRRGAFYMLPCCLASPPNCTGEHCSPLREPKSLPCVKGGGCAKRRRRDCDITRASRFSGKATIPQSALTRSQPFGPGPLCRCATSPHTVGSHPLHKGAFYMGGYTSKTPPTHCALGVFVQLLFSRFC